MYPVEEGRLRAKNASGINQIGKTIKASLIECKTPTMETKKLSASI